MATESGTDKQDNFFSATATGSGIGTGGPIQISLPVGFFPTDGIYDPADATSQLYALKGANSSDPSKYDAIVKLCNGEKADVVVKAAQGFEDSVNMADGFSGSISGTLATSSNPGKRTITDKGNPGAIIYGPITIANNAGRIELGMWLDQSYAASGKRDLSNVRNANGTPVVVVVGHAAWPKTNSSQKIDILASIGFKFFWWFKRVARIVKKVPLGTVGPTSFLGINLV
jgi:hypothetical protein